MNQPNAEPSSSLIHELSVAVTSGIALEASDADRLGRPLKAKQIELATAAESPTTAGSWLGPDRWSAAQTVFEKTGQSDLVLDALSFRLSLSRQVCREFNRQIGKLLLIITFAAMALLLFDQAVIPQVLKARASLSSQGFDQPGQPVDRWVYQTFPWIGWTLLGIVAAVSLSWFAGAGRWLAERWAVKGEASNQSIARALSAATQLHSAGLAWKTACQQGMNLVAANATVRDSIKKLCFDQIPSSAVASAAMDEIRFRETASDLQRLERNRLLASLVLFVGGVIAAATCVLMYGSVVQLLLDISPDNWNDMQQQGGMP